MKKIALILGIALMGSSLFAKPTYTDSLDLSLVVTTDTVIYFSTAKISRGGQFSAEFEYSTLNANTAVIWFGCSNYGNTFNGLQGWKASATDSVTLNVTTGAKAVNGHAPNILKRSVSPATQAWYSSSNFPFVYGAIRIKKWTVTTGKIYWKINQL